MEKGIIKKIDELGRVVIPKDIRNNLKLKTGDILSINVDNDVIKLTKHSDPEMYKQSLKKIVEIFKDVFELDLIITDRENIIVSSNYHEGVLDAELKNYVINGEYFNSTEKAKINLGSNSFEGYYYIEPLITSLSSVGAIILLSSSEISSVYIKIIKFLGKYIQNIFDISC